MTSATRSMLGQSPLLMLIDGHALVHRAFHAFRDPLHVQSTGEEVSAVFGFLNMLLRAREDWQPTHCAVAFDLPGPTFRHAEYDEYKAHRPPTPAALRSQLERVRQLVAAFGIPIFEVEGFEADDVLGSLCKQAESQQVETIVLSGDSDLLQLVSPLVRVVLASTVRGQKVYDEAAVRERYGGLGPERVPDIKAIQGDSSDNIPGVRGIGPKHAIRLLTQFGTLEGIYDRVDEVTPVRFQKALEDSKETSARDKRLTTIAREVPIELDLSLSRMADYDRDRVVEFLRELEFHSVIARLPGGEPAHDQARMFDEAGGADADYRIVDTEEALSALIAELDSPSGFSFDTETTATDPMTARLVGLSFSNATGVAWYVPVGHREGRQIPQDRALAALKPLFECQDVPKAAHNANYDVTVLANHGIQVRNLQFDTMLAAHFSGRQPIGLKALALNLFHVEMTPISDLLGRGRKQITMDQVEIERCAPYAAADADFTERLRGEFERDLENNGLSEAFHKAEMPLVPVLVRMQRNGVALDTEALGRMSVDLGDRLREIAADMYETVGHEFNINSGQQLGDVLFKELRLPTTKRTKTGFSTDAASLDGLKEQLDRGEAVDADPRAYAVLGNVLDYRQLSKLKSTYLDSLPNLVNPHTRRIHTRYNQTGSATGRVSSSDPNVQNIPVRTELGRQVRSAFVAEHAPDWTLLAADYSQIELRVLADLSGDASLLDAFRNGEDIHASTAAAVYGVGLDDVDSEMRRVAKIMNFGVVYGLSPFGIRQQTGFSAEEGARFIETYFGRYPSIRDYIEGTKEEVRAKGYVETKLGRRRYIHEARSGNRNVRASGERMAVNMPIQGTAADIIKIAMIDIQNRLDDLDMATKMILQVHDELIFEAPNEEMEQLRALVMELMPSAMTLKVPLEVEVKTGYRWGEME